MFLSDLVRKERLESTLEVGMAYGLSMMFLCQALHDNGGGRHIAIDPYQEASWQSIGLLNMKRCGLDGMLHFMQAASDVALPRLCEQGQRVDFAFIDGMHLFDYILVDFFYVDKMLKAGGFVVFDDTWMPAVRRAIAFIIRNKPYAHVAPLGGKRASWMTRANRIRRRAFQNPLQRDYSGVKFRGENVCILQKLADDSRQWDYHRSF